MIFFGQNMRSLFVREWKELFVWWITIMLSLRHRIQLRMDTLQYHTVNDSFIWMGCIYDFLTHFCHLKPKTCIRFNVMGGPVWPMPDLQTDQKPAENSCAQFFILLQYINENIELLWWILLGVHANEPNMMKCRWMWSHRRTI